MVPNYLRAVDPISLLSNSRGPLYNTIVYSVHKNALSVEHCVMVIICSTHKTASYRPRQEHSYAVPVDRNNFHPNEETHCDMPEAA